MNLIEHYGLKDVYLTVIPKLNRDKEAGTLWSHSLDVAERFRELTEKLWRPPVGPEFSIEKRRAHLQTHPFGLESCGRRRRKAFTKLSEGL